MGARISHPASEQHDLSKLEWRMPVPCSTQLDKEQIATSTPECQASVLVARRHRLLVRCSHWRNVPSLRGLIQRVYLLGLSGLSAQIGSPDREFRSPY